MRGEVNVVVLTRRKEWRCIVYSEHSVACRARIRLRFPRETSGLHRRYRVRGGRQRHPSHCLTWVKVNRTQLTGELAAVTYKGGSAESAAWVAFSVFCTPKFTEKRWCMPTAQCL